MRSITILRGSTDVTILRYITSAAGYTLCPAAVVVIIDILLRRRKSAVILWIPVVLIGIIAFTSYYTHLIMLVILTVRMHRYITSGEIFTIVYIAAICVAATVLESRLSGYKFLLTGAMATSCALYYVILYIETYRRDPLTGLMNRKSFYLDAGRYRNRNIAVISIDLNGLKEINDTKGHSAGDNFDDICNQADAHMYTDKRHYKHRDTQRG